MASDSFLILLGGLLVVAFLADEAFRLWRIPSVLVLMACGLLLGPITHLLPAEEFTRVAPHFGALAFLLILLEGGLDLQLRTVLLRLAPGATLALLGFLAAFATAAIVARVGGLPWSSAVVLGLVLAPISGAIVLPLSGKLGLRPEVRTLVVLEGALADVLGVLGLGLAVQLKTGGGLAGLVALGSLLAALFSVVLAAVAGLAWPRLVRELGDRRYVHVLTFGVALLLWGGVELLGAPGALAVLTFGLVLGNEGEILRSIGLDPSPVADVAHRLAVAQHEFVGQLTFLVRAFFFVFLGVVVQFAALGRTHFAGTAAVLVAFLVGRWLLMRSLESRGSLALERRERAIVWLLQPRGLVSAVLAIEAAHLGLPGGEGFLGVASLVIVGSNVLMAVGLRTLGPDPGTATPAGNPGDGSRDEADGVGS